VPSPKSGTTFPTTNLPEISPETATLELGKKKKAAALTAAFSRSNHPKPEDFHRKSPVKPWCPPWNQQDPRKNSRGLQVNNGYTIQQNQQLTRKKEGGRQSF
jgi:hypothetical protein